MKWVPLWASAPNGKCALNALATLPVGGLPLSRSWTFALLRHLDFKAELDLSLSRGDCRWEGLGGAVGVVIADRGGRSCVMMLVMSGGCLPFFGGAMMVGSIIELVDEARRRWRESGAYSMLGSSNSSDLQGHWRAVGKLRPCPIEGREAQGSMS